MIVRSMKVRLSGQKWTAYLDGQVAIDGNFYSTAWNNSVPQVLHIFPPAHYRLNRHDYDQLFETVKKLCRLRAVARRKAKCTSHYT
jgi:hypothetical protein